MLTDSTRLAAAVQRATELRAIDRFTRYAAEDILADLDNGVEPAPGHIAALVDGLAEWVRVADAVLTGGATRATDTRIPPAATPAT